MKVHQRLDVKQRIDGYIKIGVSLYPSKRKHNLRELPEELPLLDPSLCVEKGSPQMQALMVFTNVQTSKLSF